MFHTLFCRNLKETGKRMEKQKGITVIAVKHIDQSAMCTYI